MPVARAVPSAALALAFERLTKNRSFASKSVSPTTVTGTVAFEEPAGIVSVPLAATKSDGEAAVPGAVANETVTAERAVPLSETLKVAAAVPASGSAPLQFAIDTLHW